MILRPFHLAFPITNIDKTIKWYTLILGCTHYPLLIKTIKNIVGNNINIVSSSVTTAKHVKESLLKKRLVADKNRKGKNCFYVSDKPDKFNYLAKLFLQNKAIKVIKVVLE